MKPKSASRLPSRGHAKSVRHAQRVAIAFVALVAVYLALAYLLIPLAWERYAKRHPSFDDNPRITETADGHPGDPLNVALIGSEDGVHEAMRAAKWYRADALGFRSDIEIAEGTVLKRAFDRAPVSDLYLFGRKQDLAFEQPVGDSPRRRNHVRLWLIGKPDALGRPVWIGAASYDERVGLSHTTGQITHHVAPDVDAERDHLFASLQQAGTLSDTFKVEGFHKVLRGRNGGGDPWYTDGALWVGTIAVKRER